MAGHGIKISIDQDSIKKAKTDFKDLLNSLQDMSNKNPININLVDLGKALNDLIKKLDDVGKKAKDTKEDMEVFFDRSKSGTTFNNDTIKAKNYEELKTVISRVTSDVNTLNKVSVSMMDDVINKAVLEYENGIGRAVKETLVLQETVEKIGDKETLVQRLVPQPTQYVDNLKKSMTTLNDYDKALEKIKTSFDKANISDSGDVEKFGREYEKLSTLINILKKSNKSLTFEENEDLQKIIQNLDDQAEEWIKIDNLIKQEQSDLEKLSVYEHDLAEGDISSKRKQDTKEVLDVYKQEEEELKKINELIAEEQRLQVYEHNQKEKELQVKRLKDTQEVLAVYRQEEAEEKEINRLIAEEIKNKQKLMVYEHEIQQDALNEKRRQDTKEVLDVYRQEEEELKKINQLIAEEQRLKVYEHNQREKELNDKRKQDTKEVLNVYRQEEEEKAGKEKENYDQAYSSMLKMYDLERQMISATGSKNNELKQQYDNTKLIYQEKLKELSLEQLLLLKSKENDEINQNKIKTAQTYDNEQKRIYNEALQSISRQYDLERQMITAGDKTLVVVKEKLQAEEQVCAKLLEQLDLDKLLLLKKEESMQQTKTELKLAQELDRQIEERTRKQQLEESRKSKLGNKVGSPLNIGSSDKEIEEFIQSYKGLQSEVTKTNEVLDRNGNVVKQVEFRVKEGKDAWKLYQLNIDKTSQSCYLLDKGMKDVQNRQMSIISSIGHAVSKLTEWAFATGIVYSAFAKLREGLQFTTELNSALTQISVVTYQTQEEVGKLALEYNNLAKEMRVSTQEIADASVEYYRQGLTQAQVMERMKTTTQYAKISNLEFKESAEILTATVNSMNIPIERATDVFSFLGDSTATGSDEIGRAFQKVGGSANALDASFEKVSSYIAVLSSRTREGSEAIGNSVKSIMLRYQQLKEKGFDEEDGTKVNAVAKALNSVNISIIDSEGNFRQFTDVMDELGAKWGTLNNRTKAYISTQMAGRIVA